MWLSFSFVLIAFIYPTCTFAQTTLYPQGSGYYDGNYFEMENYGSTYDQYWCMDQDTHEPKFLPSATIRANLSACDPYFYEYYPYGDNGHQYGNYHGAYRNTWRPARDACSYPFLEQVSGRNNLYRLVYRGSDPSGFGAMFFNFACGISTQDSSCAKQGLSVFIYDVLNNTYSSYLYADGTVSTDHSSSWFVIPDSVSSQPATPAETLHLGWHQDEGIAEPDSFHSTFSGHCFPSTSSSVASTSSSIPIQTSSTSTTPTSTNYYTYTITVTTTVPATVVNNGVTLTSAKLTTFTTTFNASEAYSFTRSISSVSRASSISARISSISAGSASRASSRTSASLFKAYVRSTHSVAKASHSSSLSAARESVASQRIVHANMLAAARTSRSSVDATHYATLSINRASRSSYDEIHYSTLSANRLSRSSVRQSKSNAQLIATISRAIHSIAVASSKSVASVSRASARSSVSASKLAASVSRASASSVRSASLASKSAQAAAKSLGPRATPSDANLAMVTPAPYLGDVDTTRKMEEQEGSSYDEE